MKLPSETLNREFVLEDEPVLERDNSEQKYQVITTHGVHVGNIGLLLPANEESEVVDNLSICRLPNTPTWFNGVTSLRGNMIPVFDVHDLLGFESKGQARKMVIVGTTDTAAALWVDGMPRMVMVTSDDTMKSGLPLPQLMKDHARNFFLKDDQVWIDWDAQGFFTAVGDLL